MLHHKSRDFAMSVQSSTFLWQLFSLSNSHATTRFPSACVFAASVSRDVTALMRWKEANSNLKDLSRNRISFYFR
jgi:hypothetical protein